MDMKIIFCSDLHADFNQPKIEWPEGDILVIGGDTANTVGGVLKVVNRAAKYYRDVVMVDGNHENYSNRAQKRTVEDTIAAIAAQLPENVHFLGHHRPHVFVQGVHFVGCNGWYSFDASGDPMENRKYWRGFMNDCDNIGFDVIEQMQPWDRAVEDARLIRDTIDDIAGEAPIIAVTHTAPHRDMIEWRDNDPSWNHSNAFYMNSHMQRVLESEVGQRVTAWYNGHTHRRKDQMIGKVYCLANPRGYPSENPTWEPVEFRVIM